MTVEALTRRLEKYPAELDIFRAYIATDPVGRDLLERCDGTPEDVAKIFIFLRKEQTLNDC